MTKSLWENKLVAWLHDPAEKCFVLFHDPSGHEKGTIKKLLEELRDEIDLDIDSKEINSEIEIADHIAASADRPQWPREEGEGRYAKWSQVDFASDPVLIHPLTGTQLKLYDLTDIDYKSVKEVSYEHFERILNLGNDAKLKFLALWRFATECKDKLGQLWQLLPADTRVPDHSIWNHLDLTSAFAGARFDKKKVSILNMAFGPVQSFIAQARATSDLWAGSHLLSSMVWEGMKVIADEIGPDAFLFPQIRGLAIVDLWLMDKAKEAGADYENLWKDEFRRNDAEWLNNSTDSNPLFAACLPNKFSAIVPSERALELAEKVKTAVRNKIKEWTKKALEEIEVGNSQVVKEQVEKQLEEFPQVFMTSVDWEDDISDKSAYLEKLKQAYSIFSDDSENFFNKDYWKTIKNEVSISGTTFWKPKAGVVYPAIYELADKSLAASKSLRDFKQLPQEGFRCTLCGEREWLTRDRDLLKCSPGKRNDSIWSELPNNNKKEHLCAICTLKRFWPRVFVDMVKSYIQRDINRFVVSTHTMSLIPTINSLIDNSSTMNGLTKITEFKKLMPEIPNDVDLSILPKKFCKDIKKAEENTGFNDLLYQCKRLPSYIDVLRDNDDFKTLDSFYNKLKNIVGTKPETYYALILMDGDNMGAWLSSTETERRIPYSASWHPRILEKQEFIDAKNGNIALDNYLNALKSASPTRHAAISQALNNYSSKIVPYIIEEKHNGKLIYSGGDDVLAMASTDEVIDIIKTLRMAYSGFGHNVANGEKLDKNEDYKQNGFVLLKKKLLQVMGLKASASVGAVIVHHQTPLAYALKCLREAEHTAKNAGRNSFCIRIIKRAGGEISFTDNWWSNSDSKENIDTIAQNGFSDSNSSIGLFEKLIISLANDKKMSRKAFYGIEEWIHLLPEYNDKWSEDKWNLTQEMASSMLKKQFAQHGALEDLAVKVVDFIWNKARKETNKVLQNPIKQLESMLYCAEFMARETRSMKFNNENTESKETENE